MGVHIIKGDADFAKFMTIDWPFASELMIERYIPGKELSVSILGDRSLEPIEIHPKNDAFYNYEAKYDEGGSHHIHPAAIHPAGIRKAKKLALATYHAIGRAGVARVDMRYDDTKGEPGQIYVLEINTQPGLTPTSLVPDAARHDRMRFPDLIDRCLQGALTRFENPPDEMKKTDIAKP